MKRTQSILVSSVLVSSIIAFFLGWVLAKNIQLVDGSATTGTSTVTPGQMQPGADSLKIRDIDEVWDKLQSFYYDASKLDATKMEYSAVKGFVAGIGDPYTVFMSPEEYKDFEDGLEGQLEGIGAELEVKDGKLIVVTPLKNSPAAKSGIQPGDIILKIDGKIAEELTLFEAIRRIRGKKGTQVTLTIGRENLTEPRDITITRSEIVLDSVTVEKLDGDIFHVSINQFNDHTKTEFQKAVEQILLEKARGIVLDLRGNGGGYLDISVDILSELIAGERTAVIIKKRDQSQNETVKTSDNARIPDVPLVVLINKGSASASEIVAGAIQDYKRGIVMGEKSFGKGSVQEINKLNDGASLRLTIAKWFTPLNRTIDEVGISPDVEIKMTEEDQKAKRDPQLDAAVNYLKKR